MEDGDGDDDDDDDDDGDDGDDDDDDDDDGDPPVPGTTSGCPASRSLTWSGRGMAARWPGTRLAASPSRPSPRTASTARRTPW